MRLTDSQQKVIYFPYESNSTLKVIAGPGSGKTITLLHRVRQLIVSEIVRPDEILILSLTNKAVDNITDKLLHIFESDNLSSSIQGEQDSQVIKEIVQEVNVSTIHGLANRIVTENDGMINIIGENGWRGLMKLVSSEFWKGSTSSTLNPREFERLYKQYLKYNTGNKDDIQKLLNIMNNCKVFTNEDLVKRASDILDKNVQDMEIENIKELTNAIKSKYKIVIIDEFQDLYPSLLPLLSTISNGKRLELFGDVNQSIYQFMGSNREVIEVLEKLPSNEKVTTLQLKENFRSSTEIVDMTKKIYYGNTIVSKTSKGNGIVKGSSGVVPLVLKIADPTTELDFIVSKLNEMVAAKARLSDIAILSRTNSKLEIIANYLSSYGIPFQKLSANPDWINDPKIQFLIDLLKFISETMKESEDQDTSSDRTSNNWESDFSLIVTMSTLKNLNDDSIQKLYAQCNKRKISLWRYINDVPKSKWPISTANRKRVEAFSNYLKPYIDKRMFDDIVDPVELLQTLSFISCNLETKMLDFKSEKEIQDFKTNLEELLRVLKICGFNKPFNINLLDWFLETYFEQSLVVHNENSISNTEGIGSVKLSTIHSSKGLEFPIVFLVGGELNNKFPIENNVLYVAMTRAKNLLYMLNINHPRVLPNATIKSLQNSLIDNTSFWKYYNEDLKRQNYMIKSNHNKYYLLQRRFGFNALEKRAYSTASLKTVSGLCKYLCRR